MRKIQKPHLELKKILFATLVFITLLTLTIFVYQIKKDQTNKVFLANLKGEIVFTLRDNNGISDIYKISANGTNKKLIYHNEDKINSNSFLPLWSEDGTTIYFTAMKNGEWKKFAINAASSVATVLENEEPFMLSPIPMSKDISIDKGNVFYTDENGKVVKVYTFINYDFKFNRGAEEVSWSPDKKYLIIQSCGSPYPLGLFGSCKILVANREGTRVVKITDGYQPNWKY